MNARTDRFRGLGRWLFERGSAKTAALFRVAFASALLVSQLAVLPDVALYFSDQGVVPNDALAPVLPDARWSLIHLTGDPTIVRIMHVALLASITAVLFGFGTTISAGVMFVLLVSFRHRNPLIENSGDQIVTIAAFWMVFLDAGRTWSIDAALRRRRGGSSERPFRGTFALRMLQIQLCVVYAAATIHKLTLDQWIDGTRMFNVLAIERDWSLPMVWLMDHPMLYRPLTWATLVFEGAYPLLVWWRRTRGVMITLAIVFHAAIGVLLMFPFFSLVMIAMQTCFVTPQARSNQSATPTPDG